VTCLAFKNCLAINTLPLWTTRRACLRSAKTTSLDQLAGSEGVEAPSAGAREDLLNLDDRLDLVTYCRSRQVGDAEQQLRAGLDARQRVLGLDHPLKPNRHTLATCSGRRSPDAPRRVPRSLTPGQVLARTPHYPEHTATWLGAAAAESGRCGAGVRGRAGGSPAGPGGRTIRHPYLHSLPTCCRPAVTLTPRGRVPRVVTSSACRPRAPQHLEHTLNWLVLHSRKSGRCGAGVPAVLEARPRVLGTTIPTPWTLPFSATVQASGDLTPRGRVPRGH